MVGVVRALVTVLLALALTGCLKAPNSAPYVEVGLPDVEAGGFAPCASSAAELLAVPLRIDSLHETTGLTPGIHRTDNRTLTWIWASYTDTQRQDAVSRVNEVQVFREPTDGSIHICTRVELQTPTRTDGTSGSYDVGARIQATRGALPPGDLHVVINWIAGCNCPEMPRGNTTKVVPEAT